MASKRAPAASRSRLLFEAAEEAEPLPEEAPPAQPPAPPEPAAAAPLRAAAPRPAAVTALPRPVGDSARLAVLRSEPIRALDLRKTTQKFHRAHLNYLDAFVDSLWVDDESRLSRDFIVRVILRAVLELGLTLDFEAITLNDEVEMVRRLQDALAEHFAS